MNNSSFITHAGHALSYLVFGFSDFVVVVVEIVQSFGYFYSSMVDLYL